MGGHHLILGAEAGRLPRGEGAYLCLEGSDTARERTIQVAAPGCSEGLGLNRQGESEAGWQVCWRAAWEVRGQRPEDPGGEAGGSRCVA